ncbi:MAG: YebC/PmpR family DNA-binding transcriptional regulator, partial [Bacteroidia bacterium]
GGAEEVERGDDNTVIYTLFDNYGNMQKKLAELGIEVQSTEVQQIPNNTTVLGLEEAKDVLKIIDKFEEDDDIQAVYHNLELTEEIISDLSE